MVQKDKKKSSNNIRNKKSKDLISRFTDCKSNKASIDMRVLQIKEAKPPLLQNIKPWKTTVDEDEALDDKPEIIFQEQFSKSHMDSIYEGGQTVQLDDCTNIQAALSHKSERKFAQHILKLNCGDLAVQSNLVEYAGNNKVLYKIIRPPSPLMTDEPSKNLFKKYDLPTIGIPYANKMNAIDFSYSTNDSTNDSHTSPSKKSLLLPIDDSLYMESMTLAEDSSIMKNSIVGKSSIQNKKMMPSLPCKLVTFPREPNKMSGKNVLADKYIIPKGNRLLSYSKSDIDVLLEENLSIISDRSNNDMISAIGAEISLIDANDINEVRSQSTFNDRRNSLEAALQTMDSLKVKEEKQNTVIRENTDYQINGRLLGWMITSKIRRKELLKLLDESRDNSASISSFNKSSNTASINQMASWDKSVNRMIQARESTPKGRADRAKKNIENKGDNFSFSRKSSNSSLLCNTDKMDLLKTAASLKFLPNNSNIPNFDDYHKRNQNLADSDYEESYMGESFLERFVNN
jgi:hypothetical protein